jgi:hypothetical protein
VTTTTVAVAEAAGAAGATYFSKVYSVTAMDDRPANGEETLGDERSGDRLQEASSGNRHVIASFADVQEARGVARRLCRAKDCSRVRLMIRKSGPVTEGESPEELADMDIKWLAGAVAGGLKGVSIGAVLGAVVGTILWLSGAASAALSFALAIPIGAVFGGWALAITGAFGKTWDMSYRDAATDGEAVVAVDTDDAAVADSAFTLLVHTDAQVVEEFERGERLRLETGAGADKR